MHRRKKVTVIGGGCFGTTIANIAANNGHDVVIWMRNQQLAQNISKFHENSSYLPGFKLNSAIVATTNLKNAVSHADILFIAIPSTSFRSVIQQMQKFIDNQIIISTTKGIETSTFKLMGDILIDELPNARIGALSGPNLAKEIIQKRITASVIASEDIDLCHNIQQLLSCNYFRIYSSADRYGVELAGSLKNIYAIASGIGVSLNMGENTKSLIITRSLAEMGRLATKLGANPMTLLGLAGVGDLIATCTSNLSRNFQLGLAIGKGVSVKLAQAEIGQATEGINTLKQVKLKADELQIDMPIAEGLYQIIFHKESIDMLIQVMMMRKYTADVDFMKI